MRDRYTHLCMRDRSSCLLAFAHPLYELPLIQGLLAATTNAIPKAMLSDIIDYDELHCGMRREGMHVVLETTTSQV